MIFDSLKRYKLISIIRGIGMDDVEPILQTLYEEGIKFAEVTLNTENAIPMIREMSRKFGGKLNIGAGTVLSAKMAEEAIEAGAQYIITPSVNIETIRETKSLGKLCISGAFTPTEIVTAYENGADLVKVFPVGSLGVNYIKDIRGPLSHIPLVPTGGINVTNAKAFLDSGAIALGIGSSLVKSKKGYCQQDFEELRAKARQFQQAVTI